MKSTECFIPYTKQNTETLQRLNDEGLFCFEHYYVRDKKYSLELTESEIKVLEKNGLTIEKGPELSFKTLRKRLEEKVTISRDDSDDVITTGFVDHYLTVSEIYTRMGQLMALYPGLCQVIDLPELTQGYDGVEAALLGPSVVKMMRITTTPASKSKPGFLLICGTHAREWVNPIIALELMEQLLNNYSSTSTDPDVQELTQIVDTCDIFIVPVMNTDGYNYSLNDFTMWRKNRRTPSAGSTCSGVDNNRNFGVYFGEPGSSSYSCSDTYRGPSAFSEPENQNIKYILENYPNILIGVDSHSRGEKIFRPTSSGGGHITSLPVSPYDEAVYDDLEAAANNAINAVSGKTYLTGTTSNHAGTSDEYMFFAHRIFGFDFECALSFQPTISSALNSVNEVTAAMRALLKKCADLDMDTVSHVSVVQCVDATGSMVSYGYADSARANAKRFIDLMSIDDEAGVVSFSDPSHDPSITLPENRAQVEHALTAIDTPGVFSDLKNSIDGIDFNGWTSIGAGLQKSAQQLTAALNNKYIILISDGFENRDPSAAVVLDTFPSDIKVYTIALGAAADVGLLQQIADDTGGEFYMSPDIITLHQIYNQIRSDISDDDIIYNEVVYADDNSLTHHEIEVEHSATKLNVCFSWEGQMSYRKLKYRIVTPYGTELGVQSSKLQIKGDVGYIVFTLLRPVPGKWKIEVYGLTEDHIVSAFVNSGIKVRSFTDILKYNDKFEMATSVVSSDAVARLTQLHKPNLINKVNLPAIILSPEIYRQNESELQKKLFNTVSIKKERLIINDSEQKGKLTNQIINLNSELSEGIYNLKYSVTGTLSDGSNYKRTFFKTIMAHERNANVHESLPYRVFGKITNKKGKVPSNIMVEAYDKDLLFDDKLGTSVPDEKGDFMFIYEDSDFQELILDKKPDIYFKVKDLKGKELFHTRDAVKFNVRKTEMINIEME